MSQASFAWPQGTGPQRVLLNWTVKMPDGEVLGTIKQANDIEPGSLDQSWGEHRLSRHAGRFGRHFSSSSTRYLSISLRFPTISGSLPLQRCWQAGVRVAKRGPTPPAARLRRTQ